jgi:GT2 family glycosyltransferase
MVAGKGYLLSVVVGTLNRLDRLRECIESIVRDASIPIKIYITDAGSTDGTIEYLRGLGSENISVTLHEKKLGQAKAYNEIFAKISTPYVCWLSDDNFVINQGLEKAVRILNANPRIGMVGLKVKDVQGPFFSEPYIGGISETGILNVNQGVLRIGILQGLGGFSEEFMDYGIDPDLTARVLYSGHDVVYTKSVAILHWRDWGESDVLDAQMAKQDRYKALYREKYHFDVAGLSTSRFKISFFSAIKRVFTLGAGLFGSTKALHWIRDWRNIFLGRYISPFDSIRSLGKEYHLLQRCDRETVAYYADRLQQDSK